MITINFIPQNKRSTKKTQATIYGALLTYDDVIYDLSEMPDGATVTHDIIKKAVRSGEDYEVSLILNHNDTAPQETLFPEKVIINDGESWELEYDMD
jgi:hypothetical protein